MSQIYTDVMAFTRPIRALLCRKFATITFEEMLEMANLGSQVLQIRSVEFAGKWVKTSPSRRRHSNYFRGK
jgi:aspartate kinase